MRVVILGSGVVGVTSAWYLSQAGHDVTANPARRKKPARRMPDKFHRDMRRPGRPLAYR